METRTLATLKVFYSSLVKNAQRPKTVKVGLDHARLWVRRFKRGLDVEHPITGSLANHGHDLRLIQDYLGHRHPKHTLRYTRVAAGRFEGLWPLSPGVFTLKAAKLLPFWGVGHL